jgi:hypothetical protein
MARAKFGVGWEKREVLIARSQIFFVVNFGANENLPPSCQGRRILGFYEAPQIGHIISRDGYRWRISEIVHTPTEYHSQELKQVPFLEIEYLGG